MPDSVIENEQDERLWEMMQMNNSMLLQWHGCSGEEGNLCIFLLYFALQIFLLG